MPTTTDRSNTRRDNALAEQERRTGLYSLLCVRCGKLARVVRLSRLSVSRTTQGQLRAICGACWEDHGSQGRAGTEPTTRACDNTGEVREDTRTVLGEVR